MHPLSGLPLADAIRAAHPVQNIGLTADPGAILVVQEGPYRLLNAGSGKCLSYTARPAVAQPPSQPGAAIVAGWTCGVPGKDDDLNQVWTVRSPPTPKKTATAATTTTTTKPTKPTTTASRTFPDAIIFETISPALATPPLATATGARHQFRLDLANIPPAVTPTIFSGRSAIPNKLAPPSTQILVPPVSPAVPPPPPPALQPTLAAYIETLQASPKAASTSSWQVLRVGSDQFLRKYLLFNPSSRRYLGHTPSSAAPSSSSAGPTPTSVVRDAAADGTPVHAVDLESYLKDVVAWLRHDAPKTVNVRNVVANINAQLLYFAWAFQRADLGPVEGPYRIVHDQTKLALDRLLQLAADAISPPAKSQVWDVAASASSAAGINYSIFNHVSQKPLNSGKWRLIFIPPVGPRTALAMPGPTTVVPSQFLLMDTVSLSMLGVAQVKKTVQVVQVKISDLFVEGDITDIATPMWENIVTKHMVVAIDLFRKEHGHLVWRLYPESWAPEGRGQSPATGNDDIAEGVYSFQNSSSFLDIPPATSSSIIPLSLSPPYSFPSSGSSWWRIISSVDSSVNSSVQASDAIYQTVINYRSGHAVDLSSSGLLVGRRLGNARDERWRLVAAKDGDTSFAFQNFAAYGNGVIVRSGVPAYGLSAETNAVWTVRKVDMALPDGQYLLLNLGLNLFLSASNGVTLSQTPTPWTLSTTPQGRIIATTSGDVLGAASGNAVLVSSFNPIALSRDMAKGGLIIAAISDSTVLTGSTTSTASFTTRTDSLSQRWRMVPISADPRLWTEPSWLGRTQSGAIPNVPDGVYRVTSRQSNACLALDDGGDDQGPHEVVMTKTKIEASSNQLWYIERKRDSLMQTYTITSMSRKVNLQERVADVGQPVGGLSVYAAPDGHGTPAVIASQQWMFWKASMGGKASAIGWVLQAVGGSGGLLDYSGAGSLSTRPQLEDAPVSSQMWQLDPAQAEMSSGFYRLRDTTTQAFLTFTSGSTVTTGSYMHNSSDWKLVTQSNGLYTLQNLVELSFMTGISGVGVAATPDYWTLLPSGGSVVVQNTSTRQFLTNTKGTVALTTAGTQWAFERVDTPSPVFSDQSSDKIMSANYSIVNVATSQTLDWPSSPALGSIAICSTRGAKWTMTPSIGYYSISLSNLALGSGAIASPSGFDSSLWKLIKFDTGNYRIINKVTGLLLAQDAKGSVVEETQDSLSDQRNEWNLVQDPGSVLKTPANQEREVSVANGIYVISNSSTSSVVTLPTQKSSPTLSIQDLAPYSTSARTQLWIIEQTRDSWYIIKSFPYGLCLGSNKTVLVCTPDDRSDTFRWKFIQDKAGNVRCMTKTNATFALSSAQGLSVVLYSGDLTQQWNLTRATGNPRNTKLPQGTYLISQFVPASIADVQKQAAAMSSSFKSDAVDGVTASVSLVATAYPKGPKDTLPTGVDVVQVQTALAGSDSNNAPAVTGIMATFFAALFTATQSASTTPPTGGSPRTLTLSDASDQIGGILVDFCTAAAATSIPDPAPSVDKIKAICLTTQLLANTTAPAVQTQMIFSGQIILARIDAHIQTLNVPVTPIDPNAPLTLTLTGNSVQASALVTQSLSQYFLLESTTGGAFQISHLTTRKFLSAINNAVSLTSTSFDWTVSLQRSGGYAVFAASSTNTNTVLSLSATSALRLDTFVPDGKDAASVQRWQLRRTGYYLQNQGDRNFFNLARSNGSLTNLSNGVSMTPWQPFSQTILLNGVRSDAFNTWHMDKADGGQYRLYNEFTRTLLRNSGDSDNNIITSTDVNPTSSDLWQFAKNGDDLWLRCQDSTQKWLAVNSSNSVVLMEAGAKEPFKGWQLVSLAQTERGLLTSMPRFALVSPKDQQVYCDSGLVQYAPDNSFQRYRSYTYGKNTIYINEASTKLLRNDGTSSDLSSTNDPAVWWTADSNTKITTPTAGGNMLFSPVSNTGDLLPSTLSVRIQLANGQALSVSNGSLVAEPFDRMSSAQVWSYLDWQQGRFITHTNTSSMLGVGGTSANPTLTLFTPNSYSSSALWTIDISSSSTANNNGFFPLRPFNTSFYVQPTATLSTTKSEVRFLNDSSSFAFATRAQVLNTFIRTHAPVFRYAKTSPPPLLPLSVDAYLSQATLLPINTPASIANLSTGTSLVYSGPISDGTTATCYVTVRDAHDAAYVNYTDFAFYLLYTSGWTHVTLRYNNDTKNLEAALFPSLGWIYNLDSNYNSTFTTGTGGTTNPLQILKRADGTTRLHVFVDASGTYSPTFPPDDVALITTDGKWQMVVDAGGGVASAAAQGGNTTTSAAARRVTGGKLAGRKAAAEGPTPTPTPVAGPGMVLVEAHMASDDENGTGITPPDWAVWGGRWGGTNFP